MQHPDNQQTRPFADFDPELNDGESHDELSATFKELVAVGHHQPEQLRRVDRHRSLVFERLFDVVGDHDGVAVVAAGGCDFDDVGDSADFAGELL